MLRFLVLSFALLLAACADPHADMPAAAAVAEAQEATQAGDARRALGLLKSAASRGDLNALATLAVAYERGYLHVESTGPAIHHPIQAWPWEGSRWRRAYAAELERRVAAGDPEGLRVHAARLMERTYRDGEWVEPTEAERAEALSILHDLADRGDARAMIRLGFASIEANRETGADWFRRASEAGDPQACWFEAFFIDRVGATFSALDVAAAIDRAEACRGMHPDRDPGAHDYASEVIGSLQRAASRGHDAASVQLDSLHTLGVFERHPRLADV